MLQLGIEAYDFLEFPLDFGMNQEIAIYCTNIGVIRWSAHICNPSWIPSTPSDQSSIDILVTIT